jgi:hypothetical protein
MAHASISLLAGSQCLSVGIEAGHFLHQRFQLPINIVKQR